MRLVVVFGRHAAARGEKGSSVLVGCRVDVDWEAMVRVVMARQTLLGWQWSLWRGPGCLVRTQRSVPRFGGGQPAPCLADPCRTVNS